MPIYRLLKDVTFDQAIVEAAGRAYEDLLVDLQLVDRTDPFTEIVARRVIEVVSSGVHGIACETRVCRSWIAIRATWNR